MALDGIDAIIRSVSLLPPADGTVIVNSSAHVYRLSGTPTARCSITDGTTVDFDFLQFVSVVDTPDKGAATAGTRGFAVTEGTLFTVNLVCDSQTEGIRIQDSSLTAIFAPN